MADNTIVSAAVGVGATLVLREISHSGDTALLPGSFLMGISGSEGSYTVGAIGGDATNGLDVDVTRVSGNVAVTGTFWQATQPISVASIPSHDVTNAGTFATQITGDALTALQLIDNAVSGAGFNITQFAGATVPIGAGVEATALRVTIATDSTGVVSIDDNGSSITVDGSVSVSGSVAVTGTFWQATQPVSNAGTFEVQAAQSGTWNVGTVTTVTTVSTVTTVTTVTAVGTVTTLTGSAIAHDGADSGNPHKIGARAVASVSGQTLVAANDRTDLFAGLDGVLITRPHCNLEDGVQDRATNTDGASTAFTGGMAAPGSGLRLRVTKITVANSSSSFCTVDIRDGAAGSVLWTIPCPATGGAIETFDVPLELSANTALAYDASAATTTLTISANGFISKV